MKTRIVVLGLVVSAAGMSAAAPPVQPKAGAPLPGLTPNQLLLFTEGLEYYGRDITVAEGLGPAFNQPNCAACHESPIGGWGATSVQHFARVENNAPFNFLESLGGPVRQRQAINDACLEQLPAAANHVRERVTPSVLAFGLVEAIPDSALIALEDPTDANQDGISGRAHRVRLLENPNGPLRIGRFGWKSQIASVLSFSGDAARTEMGLTNAVVPVETPPNGIMGNCDAVPEVEDKADANGLTFVQAVTAFQRYLAPPPQSPRGGMSGEAIFNQIGCAKCHVPTLQTGNDPSLEEVLRNKTIRVYSDFLLHDMGALADGIPDGEALPTEMRTPPLWNLRTRPVMLHDGSAAQSTFAERVSVAVSSHSGEGEASRAAFLSLSAADEAKVIAFLDSLGRDDYDINGDGSVDQADYDAILPNFADSDVSPDEPWAVADLNQNRRIDTDELQQLADIVGIDTDCNQNSQVDWVDIANGISTDVDSNRRPDECPSPSQCNLRTIRVVGTGGAINNFQPLTKTLAVIPDDVTLPEPGRIKGVRLTLDIQHGWVQDLVISLRRGNGSPLVIFNRSCDSFDDLDGVYSFIERSWWNPSAAPVLTSLCDGPELNRGASVPDEDRFLILPGRFERAMRSSFENQTPLAQWSLIISDEGNPGGNNTGVLRGWTLEILYEPSIGVLDCNSDGLPDCSQLDLDPGLDCDGDGEIDSCQLAGADCDANGVLDRCQVSAGLDADCDGDGVLDSCEDDSDGDDVPDACDGCPNDAGLIVPGPCGCGSLDGDADSDGVPNCSDGCPNDRNKTSPGACGCGNPDVDSDNDGALDCNDGCPNDRNKTSPGACGCGNPDVDGDFDGTPNCNDGCPADPLKTSPGACGCGTPDADGDGDGTPNCNDGCPADPLKTSPGACGCGTPDTDSDGDGTPDCLDGSNESAPLVAFLEPTAPTLNGNFGFDTESDGTTVIVGATRELVGSVQSSGAAYVFSRDANGSWLPPVRLVPSAPEANAAFGVSVAVSGDLAVVGAQQADVGAAADAGRVTVFRRNGAAWQQEAVLSAPDAAAGDLFGASVSIAEGRIFIGVPSDDTAAGANAGSVRVFERSGSAWTQAAVLLATDAAANDDFGRTVSADGAAVAIAASLDDVGSNVNLGSAYVFRRGSGSAWSQEARVVPQSPLSGDTGFGADLDLRGTRLLVAARRFDFGGVVDRGGGFIFDRVGTVWTQAAQLLAADGLASDELGTSCALSSDGTLAVLSAPADALQGSGAFGSCHGFSRVGSSWTQSLTVRNPQTAASGTFGSSVAMCADLLIACGTQAVSGGVSAAGRGFAFDTAPLDCDGDGLPDADGDGDGVADCTDGDDDNDGAADSADGCPGDPSKTSPGACGCGSPETDTDGDGTPDCVDSSAIQTADLAGPIGVTDARFGWAAAIDGGFAISGGPRATVQGVPLRGMAAIFRRDSAGAWVTDAVLTAPNGIADDRFGSRVAISGDIAVVGAPQARDGRGSVYVYRRAASGSWMLEQVLQPQLPPISYFGAAVAVSEGIIAVGAPRETIGSASQQGALYVYSPSGPEQWALEARLLAGDGLPNDEFGHSVAIRGGLLVCGMPFDDSGAVLNHGSAYLFRRTAPGAWQLRSKLTSPLLVAGAKFGREVATDGLTVAMNSPDEPMGAAFVFGVSGPQDTVSAATKLVSATVDAADAFGCGVAVSGNRVVVGALLDDVGAATDAGSVRVFTRGQSGSWLETDTVTLPGGRTNDLFGWVVALDGSSLAVGATGVDVGSLVDLGSLSIFDLSPVDCDDDGVPDTDTDGDGAADCNDADDDGDGTADATDGCPRDPLKVAPGTCGCGVPDSATDGDGDGVVDCVDNCPATGNASQSDCDGDGQGDACESQADCNGNGSLDACDVANGASSDFNGNGTPDECEAGSLLVPSEFATIQAAIDAAPQSGGIVIVAPGVYIGAINTKGKAVTVHAPAGPAQTVIDGAAVPHSLVTFNTDEGPGTVLSGFTVRRGTQGTPVEAGSPFLVGGGMFIYRASPTIVNCRISQCRGQYGAGAYLRYSSARFEGCVFANNAAVEYGGGVQTFGESPVFVDCEFTGNVCGFRGAGIHLVGGATLFERCVLRDNVALDSGGAISWDVVPQIGANAPLALVDTVLEFNFALNVGGGLWVWNSAGGTIEPAASLLRSRACGNVPDEINGPFSRDGDTVICVDCNLNGIPDADDIAANQALDCDLSGTLDSCDIASGAAADLNANGTVDECETGTLFVPSEYGTIGAAIQAAQPGAVVWVAPGTYTEAINPQGKAITIRGGGPGTVIDGTLLSTSILAIKSGEGPGTVIEDLVFRNGRAGSSIVLAPTFRGGGGAYIENASPTIRRCVFEQCRAEYGGGAYFVGFEGILEDCVFRSNTALADGGGLQIFNRQQHVVGAVIRDCLFEQNVAGINGGGLHLVDVNGHLLTGCAIGSNDALGSQNPGSGAWGVGGGISWFHITDSGPGQPLEIANCTVEDNFAARGGGGLHVHNAGLAADIVDSSFCDNSPANISGEYDDLGGNDLCSDCPGDFDDDGRVSGIDLGLLLGQWGAVGSNFADLNLDGVVSGADMGILLGEWGFCAN